MTFRPQKQAGRNDSERLQGYLPLPTTRLIVQSLMKKWNGCISECPIEDEDGQGMETLAAGLRPRDFQLRSRTYYLKGNSIPGFVGELTLENRLGWLSQRTCGRTASFCGLCRHRHQDNAWYGRRCTHHTYLKWGAQKCAPFALKSSGQRTICS